MNVLCKCTLSYDCGPAIRCVWAVLCFVDVKTSLHVKSLILDLFLLEFVTNEFEVSSFFSSPSSKLTEWVGGFFCVCVHVLSSCVFAICNRR